MFNWLKSALLTGPTSIQADPADVVMAEHQNSNLSDMLGVVRDIESAVVIMAKMKEKFKGSGADKSDFTIVEDEAGGTWFGVKRKDEPAGFYRVYMEMAPLYEGILSMDTFKVVTMDGARAKLL
jgi:hypothetical protein